MSRREGGEASQQLGRILRTIASVGVGRDREVIGKVEAHRGASYGSFTEAVPRSGSMSWTANDDVADGGDVAGIVTAVQCA
jgi:hypothetical protein